MSGRDAPEVGSSNDLFEVALRTGGLGAWETDLVVGTRTWTRSAADIFGIDVAIDQPIPFTERDHLREVMHPDDRNLLDNVHDVLMAKDEVEVAYRIMRPGDGYRHVAGRGRVIERDANGAPIRVVHIVSDVTDQYMIEKRNLMLMRELTHRTKNQLAIVLAMARRLGRTTDSFEAFNTAFSSRLGAMARSVDALVEPVWRTVPLRTLILSQLRGFVAADSQQVVMTGEDVNLDSGAGEALGQAVHELASNAYYHGALSGDRGQVEIQWALRKSDDGRVFLNFEWTEHNGPVVDTTRPPGFGSIILRSITAEAMNAVVEYDLRPSGAYWALIAPVDTLGDRNLDALGIRLSGAEG